MRLRTKLTGLMLSLTLLAGSLPAPSAQASDLQAPAFRLYLNGRELYMPMPLVNRENRILVPMRAYLESMGAEVEWHPPDRVTATLKGRSVEMVIGATTAQVDGSPIPLDVPAQIIEDRTYLPVRFLSEGLGAKVDYRDGAVLVTTGGDPRLQVVDGPLNVRQGPSTTTGILTTLPNGTVLDVVRQETGWTQVQLPRGVTGWVANQFTAMLPGDPVIDPFTSALAQGNGFLQIGNDCVGLIPLVGEKLFVPLRQSVERLGGTVAYQGTAVEVKLKGRSLVLTPDKTSALLDGRPYTLSAAPALIGGEVLLAARTLGEVFNLPVVWEQSLRTVSIGRDKPTPVCNPIPSANAYLIMDAATGVILAEHRATEPFPIASTTKIMTALLAVEMGNPGSVVTVSRNAANQEGTSVYLRTGEQRTMRELLYGLMLVSGNDAATAIGEHLAGSESAFAQIMNRRALELGATSTLFYNASGLDDYVNPYSTAKDLATISRYAMQNPEFRVYMSAAEMTIPGPSGPRKLVNKNEFTLKAPGATGVKNGWTEKANHTLVASAFRGNRELILVLLGAPTKSSLYQQANSLMDHGFQLAGKSWLLQ